MSRAESLASALGGGVVLYLLLRASRGQVRPAVAPVAPSLRNARLAYRPVGGGHGDPYPEWLRDLKGASGVYVIRERDRDGTPVVVYVGESHTDRLYETLTRHFQDVRHEA